ncbi:uncharacterized protein METZ01_LOCUS13578 [marine metagenome]|uniref:Uncharacterized protein n=1 Tax=marine metagenome TaxID=408172 RepID=A0A381P2H2_9ZZZZ
MNSLDKLLGEEGFAPSDDICDHAICTFAMPHIGISTCFAVAKPIYKSVAYHHSLSLLSHKLVFLML